MLIWSQKLGLLNLGTWLSLHIFDHIWSDEMRLMEKKMIKSCKKLQKDNEDRMLVFVVKWNLTQYWVCWLLIKEKQIDDNWLVKIEGFK